MATKTRVAFGRTVLKYNGQVIVMCHNATTTESSGAATTIYEIGTNGPTEIVAGSYTAGTITLSFYEAWDSYMFEKFGFRTNSFRDVANKDDANVTFEEIITDENGAVLRTDVYHGCRMTGGAEGHTIAPDTSVVEYTIKLAYLYKTSS